MILNAGVPRIHASVPLLLRGGGRSKLEFCLRCLSSVTDAVNPADAAAKLAAVSQPTRPIFPWRHTDTPLPRLTPGTPEAMEDYLFPSKYYFLCAIVYLNKSVWERPTWSRELAESAAWAFAQGVAAIVSNRYEIPIENVVSSGDDPEVTFSYPSNDDLSKQDETETEHSPSSFSSDGETGSPAHEESSTVDDQDETRDKKATLETPSSTRAAPDTESMISRPLRELYRSAHISGKDQLRIRLQTKPIDAVLYNLACFPSLTRDMATRNPEKFRALVHDLSSYQFSDRLADHVEKVTSTGKMETTMEIQVVIKCEEIFQVFDATTGALLQGSQDGAVRIVTHLARFETTSVFAPTDRFPYFRTIVGNWQLTDIDDLLGSKTWYQGEVRS